MQVLYLYKVEQLRRLCKSLVDCIPMFERELLPQCSAP